MSDDDPKPWFPLRTARLSLREFRQDDFDDVHAYASQPDVARYMDWGPNTPAMTRQWLECSAGADRAPRWVFAVVRRGDDMLIGAVELHVDDETHRRGSLGNTIARHA